MEDCKSTLIIMKTNNEKEKEEEKIKSYII